MASRLAVMAVVVVVAAVMMTEKSSAFEVCKMSKNALMECKPAVTRPPKAPSSACCNNVRKADIKCFCTYKDSYWTYFYGVDSRLVASLPARCGVNNWGSC